MRVKGYLLQSVLQLCTKCNGKGHRKHEFVHMGEWEARLLDSNRTPEKCEVCNGTGVVWTKG